MDQEKCDDTEGIFFFTHPRKQKKRKKEKSFVSFDNFAGLWSVTKVT